MKIPVINNFNINPVQKLSFRGQESFKNNLAVPCDVFEKKDENISYVKFTDNGLSTVVFQKLLTPSQALFALAHSKDENILNELFCSNHDTDSLEDMAVEVNSDSYLRSLRVGKLIGMGMYSLVFETSDGKILKLTSENHFPNNRKPDIFDVPVYKKGRIGRTYYYLEEKLSQDDVTQEELIDFVKEIKAKGYKMRDYLIHFDNTEDVESIRADQFGRGKNGKIYLLDPQCAIAPPKYFFDIKRIKNKLKEKLFN